MIESVKCPECNGPMTPRNGKFGKFWGCIMFPACKGTRDSMGLSKEDRESLKEEKEVEREHKWKD
jgi:ssDNA-binding Zn-finger/Zn-ribbon topoisomerase 1